MSDTILKLLRGSVRPYVIAALVSAWIGAALSPLAGASIEAATFATTALGPASMLLFKSWFDERQARRDDAS